MPEAGSNPIFVAPPPVEAFDALAVVRAAQSISSEIALDRLLATALRVLLEHAGAERGCLLLGRGEHLHLAADARLSGPAIDVQTHADARADRTPLPPDLPHSVLAHVWRTGEPLLLGDATAPSAFAGDDYFAREQPRSLLCVPLRRQARVIGVLFLADHRVAAAFMAERRAIVEALAAQTAISLGHAESYAELQQENHERESAAAALRQAEEKYRGMYEREIQDRAQRLEREAAARQEAEAAGARLQRWVDELEWRNREMARLADMVGLLQTCSTVGEFRDMAGEQLPALFESEAGALYLFHFEPKPAIVVEPSRLACAAAWGAVGEPEDFTADACWALRRARPHFVEAGGRGLVCRHAQDTRGTYACLPLVAQGEGLGLLHVRLREAEIAVQRRPFLQTVAENLALALANVRLREALRSQATRDALTGLYNRRFMEDAMARELRLAVRRDSPLAMLMLDIDHFKRLNDTFGHDVGDAVLKEIAGLIHARIRATDLAYRYGGEELLVILPDTPLAEATRLAHDLQQAVRDLRVMSGERAVPVTVSIGVAGFPEHGDAAAKLLRAADAALYRAKRDGRDRVALAGVT
ncbi:MAG TPA: diguanylate cyclase [Burkholderiaceae bacterium]|nr:diguanylate cyclase [Burkholderiaceae bacterium]